MPSEKAQERSAYAPFRTRVARFGVNAAWVLLGALALAAWRVGELDDRRVWLPLLFTAVVQVFYSVVPWRQALRTVWGDVALALWGWLIVALITVVSTIDPLNEVALPILFAVLVFSAALAKPWMHLLNTAVVIGAFIIIGSAANNAVLEQLLIPILSLVTVSLVSLRIAEQFRFEASLGSDRLEELETREADFQRLYDVATTVSVGSSLEDAVPELVGRLGTYLNAEVGLLLLYQPGEQVLEVMSPIWTSGYALDVSGYKFPVMGRGVLERVFLSGQPTLFSSLNEESQGILSELGVSDAMAVPLRFEGRNIGLIVLADKRAGKFNENDLETLTSLSTATTLVVAQLGRMDEAAETSKRLEDLARMKSDFVSVVSHELRTPLTSIIGSLATLGRPELAPPEPAAQELLESATNQANRLRRLIEDLLMVSRIENRALPQNPEDIDVERFLVESLEELPKGHDLVSVSVRPGSRNIQADPDHLKRIVINLVDNALKYAQGSSVEVIAEPYEEKIRLSVIDHGPGISMEGRDRVFERFTQLEPSATRSRGGTGLGLNIVRGLCEQMGGRLDLEETPGGGATFVVTIPRVAGLLWQPTAS